MNVTKIAAALRQIADSLEESDVLTAPPEPAETRTESQPEEAPSFAQYQEPPAEPEPEEEENPLAQSFSAIPVTTADITEAFNALAGRVGQPRAKEIVVQMLKKLGIVSFGSGTDEQKAALYEHLKEAQ